MPERHPLATPGSWVELRDVKELKAGDHMDIQDAIEGDGLKGVRQMQDAIIRALVVNWHLPSGQLPIPADAPDALRRMEIADYVKLKGLTDDAQEWIFPSDPEPEDAVELKKAQADPASPTGGGAAS